MSKKEDIEPINADGQKHGLWICYNADGNVDYKRRYLNGILHGITECYHANGKLWYKNYLINGESVYVEYYWDINKIIFYI